MPLLLKLLYLKQINYEHLSTRIIDNFRVLQLRSRILWLSEATF